MTKTLPCLLVLFVLAGCAAPRTLNTTERGKLQLIGDRYRLGPFTHPADATDKHLRNAMASIAFTYKTPSVKRSGLEGLFRATELNVIVPLLQEGLRAAGAQDRVRIHLVHDKPRRGPTRRSVMDCFVKDEKLNVLFQKLLLADSELYAGAHHMIPYLKAQKGQTVQMEPGSRKQGSGLSPAPVENWITLPLDGVAPVMVQTVEVPTTTALVPTTTVQPTMVPDKLTTDLTADRKALQDAVKSGALTQQEADEILARRTRALRAQETTARKREALETLRRRNLISEQEYRRRLKALGF